MKTKGLTVNSTSLSDSQEIKFHNNVARARYMLNETEQKLFLYGIIQYKKNDDEKENVIDSEVRFKLKSFSDAANLNYTSAWRKVVDASKTIAGTVIHIQDENNNWRTSNLANCDYEDGEVIMEFPKLIKTYIDKDIDKNFTLFFDTYAMQLKNKYALRLYQYYKSLEGYYKKNPVFEFIEEVAALKQLLGLKEKQYEPISNFISKVLTPALKEINELTDLNVKYRSVKTGRKITAFAWNISSSSTEEQDGFNKMLKEPRFKAEADLIIKMLDKAKLNEKDALNLREITQQKTLSSKWPENMNPYVYMLMYYISSTETKGITSLKGYIKKCLTDDFRKIVLQLYVAATLDKCTDPDEIALNLEAEGECFLEATRILEANGLEVFDGSYFQADKN